MSNIFIVEDEPSLQFFYSQLLDFQKYGEISFARDGEEAISMFKSFREKPKVILMDYRLPKKNGIEATKEILKMDKDVRIIFTTGDWSVKEKALSIGVSKFLTKPYSIDRFLEELTHAIEELR
jgi:DNA-binding NtrC family response regulator